MAYWFQFKVILQFWVLSDNNIQFSNSLNITWTSHNTITTDTHSQDLALFCIGWKKSHKANPLPTVIEKSKVIDPLLTQPLPPIRLNNQIERFSKLRKAFTLCLLALCKDCNGCQMYRYKEKELLSLWSLGFITLLAHDCLQLFQIFSFVV